MATKSRAATSSRPASKATSITADQLAKEITDKLTIGNAKSGKAKGKQQGYEDEEAKKIKSMRAVNTASQSLSNVIQSGWKRSTAGGGASSSKVTINTVSSSAAEACKHLGILRRIYPRDIDVERAATSVLGKLVSLEMYDLAAVALEEMHPRLCSLANSPERSRSNLHCLSIPQGLSPPTDPVVLNLLSTFLVYSIVLASRPECSSPNSIQELSTTLDLSSTHSLLTWLPHFSSLPTKQIDSLLTRSYTTLTKLCSSSTISTKPPSKPNSTKSSSVSPVALFSLRMYALRCLGHTSPDVIDGTTFWDQVTKFSSAFVTATTTAEESTTTLVLHAFDELVAIAERRPDKQVFMSVDESGKGFIAFCDYWSSFAKRAGNISLLQRINTLMRQPSTSLITSPVKSPIPQTDVLIGQNGDKQPAKPALILEGTKLSNTFAQLSLLLEDALKGDQSHLENNGSQLLSLVPACITNLESSNLLLFLKQTSSSKRPPSNKELDRVCAKVDRAVEKVRRMGIKVIDQYASSSTSVPPSFSKVNEGLHTLLIVCVTCLQNLLSDETLTSSAIQDILTRSLDTLFFLARVTLKTNDSMTFIPTFERLSHASGILSCASVNRFSHLAPNNEDFIDTANYTRCLSGAFYNIAGTLYQASRFGNAVPFLIESCMLGEKALSLPRSSRESTTEARETEWKQVEEQLYRRWELLGVCYSKNGDKKKSIDSFKRAILKFPFASSGLPGQIERLAPDALFGGDGSPAIKQLVALVDRVTYIGACELFLPPEAISFHSWITADNASFQLDVSVTGILLERQLFILEPSRWKEEVRAVFVRLLKDALEVYDLKADDASIHTPIRKARVLIRCIEAAYRDSSADLMSRFGYNSVEEAALEVENLCTMKNLGKDSSLSHFAVQYRMTAHLWVALHAHRRADPDQNTVMTQRCEEARRLIMGQDIPSTANTTRSPKIVKKFTVSPKITRVARIVSPKVTRTTRQKVPQAPKKAAPVRKMRTNNPVSTSRSKTRTASQPAMVDGSPSRRSVEGKSTATRPIIFDNFDEVMKLLQHVARILGLLSLILAKAHVLDMARKLAQRHLGIKSDAYILASVDLAHEYITLGKLKRATSIFLPVLDIVRDRQASQEVSVRFFLRFAEALAIFEDVSKSSAVYLEAHEYFQQMEVEEKGMTTRQRVQSRTKVLEMTAMAAHVFATLQFAKGDVSASLEASLQSVRLWNRAIDNISRLHPVPSTPADANPFEMTSLKEALPTSRSTTSAQGSGQLSQSRRVGGIVCELEWSLSEGLLSTLLFVAEIYFLRGSPREAEYFARHAAELAEQLNVPAMMSRALARLGEVQLHMGRLQEVHVTLMRAADLLQGMPGLDAADICRLKVEYHMKMSESDEDPIEQFGETVQMLENLDDAFQQFDHHVFGPRRSLGLSPGRRPQIDVLAPALLSSILSQQLWLLRNELGDKFDGILEKFLSLSHSKKTKAEENSLMANLTLHSIYGRFQTDMFLSSLTESTIAVPIGMRGKEDIKPTSPSPDILDALCKAEKLLLAHFDISALTGSVIKVRETLISIALVYAFRTSLGDQRHNLPFAMAALLDASTCLTLRRDMLDVIDQKLSLQRHLDDLQWPSPHQNSTPTSRPVTIPKRKVLSLSDTEDDEDDVEISDQDSFIWDYWRAIREQYRSQMNNALSMSSSETSSLPSNWTVVSISVTPDKSTLLCCRREGGDSASPPLVFCIPLKERREHGGGGDEETHLTFDGALEELQDIIRLSDASTKAAVHIKSDDEEARSNWWKQRSQLDVRMRELLENIEYCWLGAFKTILSPRPEVSPDMISDLRVQFEKVFDQNLRMKGKKTSKARHKKSTSQGPTYVPGQFKFEENFIRCFSTLSPRCRDGELEDLVYFVLDLYQYHGVPVAVSEVDIDQVVVDLRTVLEDYSAKQLKHKRASKPLASMDDHIFLILDKNVQGIPWESLPILRGRGVSRIPGVQFLHDRIEFARRKAEINGQVHDPLQGAVVNPRNGYFILNPSGDLRRTEERFRNWANGMKTVGWEGTIGQPVSEQQFVEALRTKDLVVYFGHGGGEQFIRPNRIRNLPTCAATMLWGCSSGALRDLGDFDRTGIPYNYMLAGCPTLVANLWDVTDKDIDKLCLAVLDKMSLNSTDIAGGSAERARKPVSLVTAVAQSRDSTKLKYLTGAAPVVYGIPFYL